MGWTEVAKAVGSSGSSGSSGGGGSGLIGGALEFFGGFAAKRNAKYSAETAREALNFQKKMYSQTQRNLTPYINRGHNALKTYVNMAKAGPGEFETDPGYQFRLDQGEKALNAFLSSRGKSDSGEAANAFMDYNQGMASNEYQNFINRYYQSMSPFQDIAKMGQNAAAGLGTTGASIGSNVIGASNAMQNAYQAQTGAAYGLGNAAQSMFSNYLYGSGKDSSMYDKGYTTTSDGNSATATFND